MIARLTRLGALLLLVAWIPTAAAQTDPLPSWNEGPAKQSIIAFVTDVTREGSPDFVPPPERIATFDNDGTLWIEQPIYVQFAFALDRVKALAPQHPGMEGQAALQGGARRRHGGGRGRRRDTERSRSSPRRMRA